MKRIILLGASGSIGTQSIDVIKEHPDELCLVGAGVGKNVEYLKVLLEEFDLKYAYAINPQPELEKKYPFTKFFYGEEGLANIVLEKEYDLFENALVGFSGFIPTINAINNHKDIALANKETLVAGGSLVMDALKKNNVNMYPVDSEHSAIFQCLQGMNQKKELKKLILTASGGPFFGKKIDDLKNVTVKDALNHPNWSMGAKITIDSASMMNKGLEIIEASWLFDMPQDKIDVVVHRESIIHSMIEFVDNSVIAQLGLPDMRIPIQYAITFPNRYESPVKELDLTEISNLSFYKPDYETFKCLRACKKAIEIGKTAPAIANGANEVANKMFRDGKIKFLEIGDLVYDALNNVEVQEIKRVEDVLNADKSARQYVLDSVK